MKDLPSFLKVLPSSRDFSKLSRDFNRIPLFLDLQCDFQTPLSIYSKFSKNKNAFLLESVEKNEKVSRYSIIGFEPSEIFEAKDGVLTHRNGSKIRKSESTNPLQDIKKMMSLIRQSPAEDGGFMGGLVGYIGYDSVRYFEKLPSIAPDDLKVPDMYLLLTDKLIVFDHLDRTMKLIVNVKIESGTDIKKAYAKALKAINEMMVEISKPLKIPEIPIEDNINLELLMDDIAQSKLVSNMKRPDFVKMVEKVKEYIRSGDVIQVVGSQRFKTEIKSNAMMVYRVLRRLNPSPYMFLLHLEGIDLVGSSPEMFIKVVNGIVETRPIAGSRPRGRTDDEDKDLEKDLLCDQKELAEHIMLVDLARNDLGRVCEYGTVKVNEFKIIERYSHIMHIVSDVTGKLKKGKTAYDAFQSCFPAGTLSGAPKIRAMEIIEEVEPSRRGIYGGAVVIFGFDGNMDSAITIRSAVIKHSKNNMSEVYVQAGAGLVADSVPQTEFDESSYKSQAVQRALYLAEINTSAKKGGKS